MAVLLILVGIGVGYIANDVIKDNKSIGQVVRDTFTLGASSPYNLTVRTIAGTSDNLCKMPASYVFEDSTTTDPTFEGCAINQLLNTSGINQVRLNVMAKGGVSSSTLAARVMYSQDGANYFDSATSSKDLATTTLSLFPSAYTITPGLATTSYSFLFDIAGAKYTRLLLIGSDGGLDNDHLIKAWIQAINLQEY